MVSTISTIRNFPDFHSNSSIFCRTLMSFSGHAIVMGLWVFIYDRSPFCASHWLHSLLFSLILGFVFIFNYILPKARQTRYRYAIFYTLCFIENVICVILYINYSTADMKNELYFLPLCILSIVPFIIGILFMILYYCCFHPNVVSRRRCVEEEMKTIKIEPAKDPKTWIGTINDYLDTYISAVSQNLLKIILIHTYIHVNLARIMG